jgi:hypothetical protein
MLELEEEGKSWELGGKNELSERYGQPRLRLQPAVRVLNMDHPLP